jgi:hypothetical protein
MSQLIGTPPLFASVLDEVTIDGTRGAMWIRFQSADHAEEWTPLSASGPGSAITLGHDSRGRIVSVTIATPAVEPVGECPLRFDGAAGVQRAGQGGAGRDMTRAGGLGAHLPGRPSHGRRSRGPSNQDGSMPDHPGAAVASSCAH